MTRNAGAPSKIIEATIESNNARKLHMVDKIINAAGGSLKGKTIALLGITFKAGTDDVREGASLVIVPELLKAGASIRAYDPQGMKEAAKHLKVQHRSLVRADAEDAMKDADMLVLLTDRGTNSRSLELKKVRSLLKHPLVVDLRNIYKRQDMQQHGFHYVSIGRQDVIPGQPWIADLNIDDEKAA